MKILFYDDFVPAESSHSDIFADEYARYYRAMQVAGDAGLLLVYQCISAAIGPREVLKRLEYIQKDMPKCTIVTNSVIALDNRYAWNNKTNSCDVWFWKKGEWVNIQDTTEREIRQGHNIMHMYLNDAFDL